MTDDDPSELPAGPIVTSGGGGFCVKRVITRVHTLCLTHSNYHTHCLSLSVSRGMTIKALGQGLLRTTNRQRPKGGFVTLRGSWPEFSRDLSGEER